MKELEALRWLLARGFSEQIDSTLLARKYENESDLRPHSLRVVAWKRASGRMMNRLREKGTLKLNRLTYSPDSRTYYDVTEAGRAAAAGHEFAFPLDAVYPIDEAHRFRVYARRGDELEVLCVSPTPEGMGAALVQLDRDAAEHGRRLVDHGAIGVLDVIDRRWIVMPWHRPEGKTRFRETEVIL